MRIYKTTPEKRERDRLYYAKVKKIRPKNQGWLRHDKLAITNHIEETYVHQCKQCGRWYSRHQWIYHNCKAVRA